MKAEKNRSLQMKTVYLGKSQITTLKNMKLVYKTQSLEETKSRNTIEQKKNPKRLSIMRNVALVLSQFSGKFSCSQQMMW